VAEETNDKCRTEVEQRQTAAGIIIVVSRFEETADFHYEDKVFLQTRISVKKTQCCIVQVLHLHDFRHCGCRKCFQLCLLISSSVMAVVSFQLLALLLNATSRFRHLFLSRFGRFEVSK